MIGRILGERYRLEEEIGKGGMAVVYRATDLRTQRNVAVKVMHEQYASNTEYVSRFQREAQAASRMTHHNIINLLDVGMDGELRYLVMEYVPGQTLKKLIAAKGRLSPTAAAQITIRILSALQHAHENGIIHRDIKPQNIMIDTSGMVKVGDFGIARMVNMDTLTQQDKVMGSVHYFSPEQANQGVADVRSDIYSVGVVLYEMLTGRVPFDGTENTTIAMKHIHARPEPIEKLAPGVPPAIVHVCMVAMNKNPDHRYQNAREMAYELRLALDGRTDFMANHQVEKEPDVAGVMQAPRDPEPDQSGRNPSAEGQEPRNPLDHKENDGRKKVNLLWVAATLATALMVLFGLYVGIQAIVNRALNDAEVPDLVGMDIAAATRAANRVGLEVNPIENNHPTVPAGQVAAQAPEGGTILQKGDTVVLTVSKGPASQMMPKLTGMTVENAVVAAKAFGLTLSVTDRVVSTTAAEGFILTQSVEPGTLCQPGDIVNVTVSGGVAIIPKTVGKPLATAQSLLTEAGLKVSPTVTFVSTEDTSLHGTVASQSLQPDMQVIRNTEVALTVYQVPSMMRTAEVTLNLPESDSLLSVRITLDISGSEVTTLQQDYTADATRHPLVRLTSQFSGTCTMRVYINGDYKYSDEVTLK